MISALMNSTVLSLCNSAETGQPISDDAISGTLQCCVVDVFARTLRDGCLYIPSSMLDMA